MKMELIQEKYLSAELCGMVFRMVRAPTPMPMDKDMSGNTKTARNMVREPTPMPMDQSMSGNGRTVTHGKEPNTAKMEM